MRFSEFERLLLNPPRRGFSASLHMWWAHKGDWERAHKIFMDDEQESAWCTPSHRLEGDLPNARTGRTGGANAAECALDADGLASSNTFCPSIAP